MTINADSQRKMITHLNTKISEIMLREYDYAMANPEFKSGSMIIKIQHTRSDNPCVIVDIQSLQVNGSIGIWFGSNTTEMLMWEKSTGECLYQHAGVIPDVETILGQIDQALASLLE